MEGQLSRGSFILELRNTDVLVGRGTHSVRHPGNKSFRKLAQQHKEAYAACNRISEKDRIAREIFHELETRGVRFLTRLVDPTIRMAIGIPEGVTAWMQIDNVAVLEKIKQQLRDVPFPPKTQSKNAKKAARTTSQRQQKVSIDQQQQQLEERVGGKPSRQEQQVESVEPERNVRSSGQWPPAVATSAKDAGAPKLSEVPRALQQVDLSASIAALQRSPPLPPWLAQSAMFARQSSLLRASGTPSLSSNTLPLRTTSAPSVANQLSSSNSLFQQAFLNNLQQQLLNTGLPRDQALDIVNTLVRRCPQVLVHPERVSLADLARVYSNPSDGSILSGVVALQGCIQRASQSARASTLPPGLY